MFLVSKKQSISFQFENSADSDRWLKTDVEYAPLTILALCYKTSNLMNHQVANVLMQRTMVNFLLKETFHGYLNKTMSTNEIVSPSFPRKIFLKSKLTFTQSTGIKQNLYQLYHSQQSKSRMIDYDYTNF